MTDWHIKS